jgi:titin
LNWDDPESDGGSDLTDYIIETKGPKDKEFYVLEKLDASMTQYTARGLQAGKSYEFRVKAKNSAGVSELCAELAEPVSTKAPISESNLILV